MNVNMRCHLLPAVFLCVLFSALAALPLTAAATDADQPAISNEDPPGEVIETETGIYYTVKKGDTLWGLSQKFSDSPYLWPDLWSDNPQVANPHRIYPGERIRLYRREDLTRQASSAPSAPVIEEPPAVETSVPEAVPPPLEIPQPPEPQPQPALGIFDYSKIDQVGFIREVPVTPHGRIFRVRDPKTMIATDDIVYIAYEGNQSLIPGRRYTIYRLLETVRDRETDKYLGVQHYLLGVLEIEETEADYAVGKVVRAFSNIRLDDLLMPYERRTPKIAKQKSPPGMSGEIIMAEEHNNIIGDNVIVFINKGENDGVKPGQSYNVCYRLKGKIEQGPGRQTTLRPEIFGEFLVLHTETTTATVFITKARRNVSPGTPFLSPQ